MPSGHEARWWPAAKTVRVVRGARAYLSNPKIQTHQESLQFKAEETEEQVHGLDTPGTQWWGPKAELGGPELDFFSLDWDHMI